MLQIQTYDVLIYPPFDNFIFEKHFKSKYIYCAKNCYCYGYVTTHIFTHLVNDIAGGLYKKLKLKELFVMI